MKTKNERTKRGIINMELRTFKIPPSGDILVLTKRCPIGPEAAKRMLDTVAPDQFELIQLNNDILEAILVKKYLFLRADRETLIKTIVEEVKPIVGPECMLTIKCEIILTIKRAI